MADAKTFDPRGVQGGRPRPEQRMVRQPELPSAPEGLSHLETVEAGSKTGALAGLRPAKGLKDIFSHTKLLFYYIELIQGAIKSITQSVRTHADLGYSEGYARVLSLAASGRDYKSLKYDTANYEEPFGVFRDELELYGLQLRVGGHRVQRHRMQVAVDRGYGFFSGKAEAIKALTSVNNVSDQDYLNKVYRTVALSRGVPQHLIPRIRL